MSRRRNTIEWDNLGAVPEPANPQALLALSGVMALKLKQMGFKENRATEAEAEGGRSIKDPEWKADLMGLIVRATLHDVEVNGVIVSQRVDLSTISVDVDENNEIMAWNYSTITEVL